MRYSILPLWILCVLSIHLFAQKTSHDALSHLKVQRLNDSYIDVYYQKPKEGLKLPIMIFCQGSGYDSNTGGFLNLLRLYEKQVVGLAIEKQGVKFGDTGDSLSKEYLSGNTVFNRVYDYLRVLQHLRSNAPWWNGDIYVIGGSEGGLIAGMLASYYPNVKGLGIFSFGGGLNFGEAWPLSRGLQLKGTGASEAVISQEINTVKDSLNYIRENATYLKSYDGKDNTYAWWASIMDLRLENALFDLNVPVFLAQGSEDVMAIPTSARKLNDDFIKRGKLNLHYKEYKGYDHAFMDSEKKSHLVEVIDETIKWLLDPNRK